MSTTTKLLIATWILIILGGAGFLIGKYGPKIMQNAKFKMQNEGSVSQEKSNLYGTMLAYNINDAALKEKGLIDQLRNGWSEFRKNPSYYKKFSKGLEDLIPERNTLLKKAGFTVNREIAGYFTWNVIEPERGQFDWTLTDIAVKGAKEAGIKLSAVVQPYASWDQKGGTEVDAEKCQALDFAYYDYQAGPPNDWEEYKLFLTKMVERYKDTVAYWEIGNEYDGECGGFKNNPAGYLELLKISYQTIKAADSQAKVLNAGALEMVPENPEAESIKNFWQQFWELGGGQYLDYFNFHYNYERNGAQEDSTIFAEHLAFFNGLMEKVGHKKPLWITEFGTYTGTPEAFGKSQAEQNNIKTPGQKNIETIEQKPSNLAPQGQQKLDQSPTPTPTLNFPTQSEEFQAAWYFRNSIHAFTQGTKRIFVDLLGQDNDRIGGSAIFNLEGKERAFLTTLKTINQKLGGFSALEKITDGQYKFTVQNKAIYTLWSGELPAAISGPVKVTDLQGQEKTLDSKKIEFSSEQPILVEL